MADHLGTDLISASWSATSSTVLGAQQMFDDLDLVIANPGCRPEPRFIDRAEGQRAPR